MSREPFDFAEPVRPAPRPHPRQAVPPWAVVVFVLGALAPILAGAGWYAWDASRLKREADQRAYYDLWASQTRLVDSYAAAREYGDAERARRDAEETEAACRRDHGRHPRDFAGLPALDSGYYGRHGKTRPR